MKKIITKKSATAVAAALALCAAWQVTAYAALEISAKPSEGTISFEVDDGVKPPVDPDHPEVEVTEPEGTDLSGYLTIDVVPELDFGEQKVSNVNKTYYAKAQKIKFAAGGEALRPNYVQVTDVRDNNTTNGWKLKVKQDAQFKNADNGAVLNNAVLTLSNGNLSTISPNKVNVTGGEIVLTLDPSVERVVMDSGTGSKQGTFVARFGHTEDVTDPETGTAYDGTLFEDEDGTWLNSAVTLFVPGGSAKKGEYKTTLTWTLEDTP